MATTHWQKNSLQAHNVAHIPVAISGLEIAIREVKRAHALTFTSKMTASAIGQELKQEISQMKRRITALERAFDSIATKDDLRAIDEARQDLKQGKTTSVSEAKKKYAWNMKQGSQEEHPES